jgi:peptidoglycan/xylan/chitin deacetylase (PgdA/CDA1 family)
MLPKNNFMHNNVSIIMYHYVRDLKHSRYPGIKGIDTTHFREQIEYFKKHYHFITMEMLIDAIDNNSSLPKKSVLLTFDDAYIEHFNIVFPLLNEQKIQGSFFPPAKAITEHTVLDVNKIHFILASEDDKSKIITEIKNELNKFRKEYNLESDSFYYDKLALPGRFDSADVIFIKRLLQVELDETLRKVITNNLFEKIVGINEDSFSRELYMDIEQIKCMHRNGMHIGSHGYDHYWLGSLTLENQKTEIEKALGFLNQIGCDTKRWTMCYPYGNYNDTTIELLTEYNCKLALTTEVNIADLHKYNKYTLPRLDTNDIPKDKEAITNDWFLKG